MKNKLKIGLLAAVLSLVLGAGSVFAADINFTVDTTVAIGGHNYTIFSGGAATAPLTVDGTSITVTVPSGSTFTFSSPDKFLLPNSSSLAQVCTGSDNSVTITGPATSVIITPNTSTTCTIPAGGGGSSSHHSSSGSSSTSTTTSSGEGCLPGNLFSTTTGKACPPNSSVPVGCGESHLFSSVTGAQCPIVSLPASYAFGTVTVKLWTKGEACKAWQMFFNDKAGAQLVLDGVCGPKTIAVAVAWQASVGLTADGLLGPMSRAKALSTL